MPDESGSEAKQARRVAAENVILLFGRDAETANALQHLFDAPDLVRVITSSKNLAGACEGNCQFDCAEIEINCVEIESLQVGAGRLGDILAAFRERVVAAIQSFREIGNGAAQVSKHPANVRKLLSHSAVNESRGGERGIE